MDGQCRVFVPRLQRYMDIELYMRNDWSLCFSCFLVGTGGASPFTVAAAVPGKGAGKSQQTTASVRSLVRPSGAFRVVVPRCCSCALCCWGLLFRPCAGGATFLLGQARASVDAHLTSPHLTSPHLTSPHLTSPQKMTYVYIYIYIYMLTPPPP